jgi:hypothetical protein
LTNPRRKRRIAADEAHAWARNLRLRNPYAKLVLSTLTLYVNGEGMCFVSLAQLAEDTEFAPETVRRRLIWLESIGAVVRMPQWLDENGRRNADGRGRRTTDEIRLMIDADPEVIEAAAEGKVEAVEGNSNSESVEISPSPRKVANSEDEEQLAPHLAPQQPPNCVRGLTSEPEPEESPQPPSGGSVEIDESWKDFEKDWQEPILRQSLAQQVWSALKPEEQNLARSAARGYVAYRKAQRKPPNVLGAHLFLKETAAWAEFAKRDPTQRHGGVTGILADSPEGKAISTLYAVTRARPFEHKGRITYPGEITPQILAFAGAADSSKWVAIEDYRQVAAWTELLNASVFGARPALAVGFRAPWPWPPSVEGKIYTTGPPQPEPTEQDMADFK